MPMSIEANLKVVEALGLDIMEEDLSKLLSKQQLKSPAIIPKPVFC